MQASPSEKWSDHSETREWAFWLEIYNSNEIVLLRHWV